MENKIDLVSIKKQDYKLLYDILKNREKVENISHKKMPTYNEHVEFIKSKPYTKWYIVKYGAQKIASIYLTSQNEIGIFIKTTHQKALELRKFIEPMITKAKEKTVHNRRAVLKKIHNSDAVKTLFDVIAPVYTDRPGGYTRIIKLGTRTNDAAKISLIEFVDKAQFKVDEVVPVELEEAPKEDS